MIDRIQSGATRREFIQILGAGAAGLLAGPGVLSSAADRSPRKKPNIVLLMADDFGYECLSCNGSTSYKTPHLDALARRGVRLTRCHSTPLCTPSRVQIMTGRYNHRNYVDFGHLAPKERTFAHMLRDAGYATCIVGKWQLDRSNGAMPAQAGFDEHCLWHIGGRQRRFWKPRIVTNGQLRKDVDDRYGPDVMCEYAEGFLQRSKDKPFLLYYPMMLTHSPFVPTPDSEPAQRRDEGNRDRRFFADMVAYTDKIVARLSARLEALGLSDNTIFLFTGDNGTHGSITSQMGDRTVQGGKGKTAETGTHVPFVAAGGGLAGGKVCDDLIDFTDFLPTLAHAAGTKPPAGVEIDGVSFLPQLQGRPGTPRQWSYCWYKPRKRNELVRYARDKTYKLFADGRLYDVSTPLVDKPVDRDALGAQARRQVARLQNVLETHQRDDG